jgi:hypothetical protein
MARRTEGDQIRQRVRSSTTSENQVVRVKILAAVATAALPLIPLEYCLS